MLSTLLTLLLVADLAPPPDAGSQRLTLTGERQLRDGRRHLYTVEGDARLVGEGLAVDADRLVYDEAHSSVTASGHVVARITSGGLAAVIADVVTLRLEGDQVTDVYLLEGRALTKKETTAEALLAANTALAVEQVGKTQVLLEGNHLEHQGAKWTAERISLVPCECDFKNPSWSVEASRATVDTEAERVSMTSSLVRVLHVPVLWLPWLSLPITERQTGLLFPKPGYSSKNGFSLEVPVFITLGRSVDITLTPGLLSGGTGPDGVAGPRLLAELRYVPSRRATGRLFLGGVWDVKHARDAIDATRMSDATRGLRGELSWTHSQDFDAGFGARAEVNAYSDGYYNRDLTTDVIASTSGLLRSGASLFQRGEHHLVALDLTLRQDLVFGYDWFGHGPEVPGATSPRFGPGVLQRFPALTLTVPRVVLGGGPFSIDFTGEFVRLAPLFSRTGDEGVGAAEGDAFDSGIELSWGCRTQRVFGTGGSACGNQVDKTGQGNRVWEAGEREARERLMLLPRLRIGGTLGPIATGAWVGWRQTLWAGEASNRTWQRGALLVDAHAETELGRVYGDVRHVVQPAVSLRAVPLILRGSSDATSLEPVPYDEVDAAIPRGGGAWAQATVELRQRLVLRGGVELLRLDLGQGFRLLSPRASSPSLSETWGRLGTRVGWFQAQVAARMDPVLLRLTRLAGTTGLDDGRGHGVNASYEMLLDDGTDRLRAPVDLLFGSPVPMPGTRAQMLGGSAFWNFGPMALRYDVVFTERLVLGSTTNRVLALAQHSVGVAFMPACDCWRLDISAVQRLNADNSLSVPEPTASLTVSRFGTIGTR